MKFIRLNTVSIYLILMLFVKMAYGQDTVLVGIKHAPPFAIKTESGWEGLTIEIWKKIEQTHNIHTIYREMDITQLTSALSNGQIDIGLGAISVSSEREKSFDFSNSFYPSGFGVMFESDKTTALKIVLNLVSGTFIRVVLLLCLVLLLVGLFIWLVERKKNPDEFEGGLKGLFSGFWWSAVTMTTVGYGDKSPKSPAGKAIGLIWMFSSLIMISYFTASIASALTVQQFESRIEHPSDLEHVKVAVTEGSIAANYLSENRIPYLQAANLDELTKMLESGTIDAVLGDYPLLRYHAHNSGNSKLKMLPHKLQEFFYAFGMAHGFKFSEEVNTTLQEYIESEEWQDELYKYFGQID